MTELPLRILTSLTSLARQTVADATADPALVGEARATLCEMLAAAQLREKRHQQLRAKSNVLNDLMNSVWPPIADLAEELEAACSLAASGDDRVADDLVRAFTFVDAYAEAIVSAFEDERSRQAMASLFETDLLKRHVVALSQQLGIVEGLPVIVLSSDDALVGFGMPGAQAITLPGLAILLSPASRRALAFSERDRTLYRVLVHELVHAAQRIHLRPAVPVELERADRMLVEGTAELITNRALWDAHRDAQYQSESRYTDDVLRDIAYHPYFPVCSGIVAVAFLGQGYGILPRSIAQKPITDLALSPNPTSLVCDWIAGDDFSARVETRRLLDDLADKAARSANTSHARAFLHLSALVSLGDVRRARGLTEHEEATLAHYIVKAAESAGVSDGNEPRR